MGLSDPFGTTYAGAYEGVGSLGRGLLGIAEMFAKKKEQERKIQAERELEQMKLDKEKKEPDFFQKLLIALNPELLMQYLGQSQAQQGEVPQGSIPSFQPQRLAGTSAEDIMSGIGQRKYPIGTDLLSSIGLKLHPEDVKRMEAGVALEKQAAELPIRQKEEQMKASVDIEKKKTEKMAEKFGDVGRVMGAFKNLVGHYKRLDKEFGGTGGGAAALYDISRFRYAPAELKQKARSLASAQAQTEEVGIGMLPIMSGQARYVESLGERIKKTIPDISVEKNTRWDLIAQSVRNMMTLAFGIKNGYFTADKLREIGIDPNSQVKSEQEMNVILSTIKLSPEEESAIEEQVKDVLSSPMISGYSVGGEGVSGGKINREETVVGGKFMEGQTATNPKTKEKIIYRGGKWQKM